MKSGNKKGAKNDSFYKNITKNYFYHSICSYKYLDQSLNALFMKFL